MRLLTAMIFAAQFSLVSTQDALASSENRNEDLFPCSATYIIISDLYDSDGNNSNYDVYREKYRELLSRLEEIYEIKGKSKLDLENDEEEFIKIQSVVAEKDPKAFVGFSLFCDRQFFK